MVSLSSSFLFIDFDTTVLPSLLNNTPSSSSYITAIQSFISSTATTVIGCIDLIPSPVSLFLLSTLSLISSSMKEEESSPLPVPIVDVENDIEINLISSSSDSYVQSDASSEGEPAVVFESRSHTHVLQIAPKKSMKRILQHSPIPEKVYRSASFSPASRMKIYQNETRLASLFNGY